MTARDLVVIALIGLAAGWVATRVLEGRGRGLVMNLALGIVGAAVGPVILAALDVSTSGLLGALITATVGAIVLLAVAHVIGSLILVLVGAVVVLVLLAGGLQLR